VGLLAPLSVLMRDQSPTIWACQGGSGT